MAKPRIVIKKPGEKTEQEKAQERQEQIKERLRAGTTPGVTAPTPPPTPSAPLGEPSRTLTAAELQKIEAERKPAQIITPEGGVRVVGLPPGTKTLQTLETTAAGRIIRATAEVVEEKPPVFDPSAGTVRALTPEESKRLKEIQKAEKSPIKQFVAGVKEAGIVTAALGRREAQVTAITDPRPFKERFPAEARQAGRLFGTVFDIAAFGSLPTVVSGVKTGITAARGTRAAQLAGRGIAGIEALPLGQTLVGAAKVTAIGVTTAAVTKKAAEVRAGITPTKYDEVFNKALREERRSVGGVKGVIAEAVPTTFAREKVFVKTAREELKKKGLSSGEVTRIVETMREERKISRFGELTGVLAAGAASEALGRRFVTENIVGTPTFGRLFTEIGKAGFAEGFGQAIVAQQARRDPRPFITGKTVTDIGIAEITTTPAIEALGLGGVGFLSAGLLGGGIGIAAVKGKKTTQRALEVLGHTLDPTELPSDIIESIARNVPLRGKLPIVVPTPTPALTLVETQRPPDAVFGEFIPQLTVVPVERPAITPAITPTPTVTPTAVPSPVPVPTDISSIIGVPTDIPAIVDIPTDIPAFAETPVTAPVTTTVPVTLPVPVTTPIFTGIPPILPFFPFPQAGAPAKRGKRRTTFRDELKALRSLFVPIPPPKKPKKKKKKKKKRTVKRRAPTQADLMKRLFG